jgi:hypothetical protein
MSSIALFLGCKQPERGHLSCAPCTISVYSGLWLPLVVPTRVDGEPASVAFECHLLAPYGAVLECRGACQIQIAL